MSSPPVLPPPQEIACTDLDAAIEYFTTHWGYRLDMIMPADAPRVALLSTADGAVRLVRDGEPRAEPRHEAAGLLIERAQRPHTWVAGRAGMHYRDLIPSRLGGRCIASHIRIPVGGPVPDYVHYHHVDFQMIYCRRGWVRVVYQDQGLPFVMRPGDCVLQPPTIRHRVLEASDGLEVIEIAQPAEHETWRDHSLTLPNASVEPERHFAGQRFVRHVAENAHWQAAEWPGFECRDTGISDATDGGFSVRVVRSVGESAADAAAPGNHRQGQYSIFFVLSGEATLITPDHGAHTLREGDSCVIEPGAPIALVGKNACELLQLTVG